MQVPPHMREAGGGLAHFHSHFPLPHTIVGSRHGTQMWVPVVGSRHGQQMWAQVWDAKVGAADVGSRHGQQPPNRGQARLW